MKETGEAHWWKTNTSATNSSGFTGLEGIVATMVHSTTLAASVTGGVLRRTILQTPGTPGITVRQCIQPRLL
jgi:hypothetical protein